SSQSIGPHSRASDRQLSKVLSTPHGITYPIIVQIDTAPRSWPQWGRMRSCPTVLLLGQKFQAACTRGTAQRKLHFHLASLPIPTDPPSMLQRQIRHLDHQRGLERNAHWRGRRLARADALQKVGHVQVGGVSESQLRLVRDRRLLLLALHVDLALL